MSSIAKQFQKRTQKTDTDRVPSNLASAKMVSDSVKISDDVNNIDNQNDSNSPFLFNFNISVDSVEVRKQRKKERRKKLKSERKLCSETKCDTSSTGDVDINQLAVLQEQTQTLTLETGEKQRQESVPTVESLTILESKRIDVVIHEESPALPVVDTNNKSSCPTMLETDNRNRPKDYESFIQEPNKISKLLNKTLSTNQTSQKTKSHKDPKPIIQLRNTQQNTKPLPIRFNTDSIVKAMVNHTSMAVHIEKAKAAVSPLKSDDTRNKIVESNAFSFGFDFTQLLTPKPR